MSAPTIHQISNTDFLRSIRGELALGEHLWVAGFPDDPARATGACWRGRQVLPGARLDAATNPAHNNYFSVAALTEGKRAADHFARLLVLVADDADRAELRRRNEWVFSSPAAADGRIVEVLKPLRKAMEAAGLPPFSLHDLRRSFGTLAEWCEVPVGVVAQIQGHKPSALAEKHYRRRPLDLLTLWHIKIEGWILEQAGIEQPDEGQAPGLRVVT